ncbi:MAG: acyl carrier protein [Deltaproteobacteria bacterium]|nr:acyl carrier protein [Deltaproteobacteria bacterium]
MTERVELREEVWSVVRRCVAESLLVDEAEVRPESRLIDDLGADSLDFVDIVFQLDRELDIQVQGSEFNFLTRLDFSSPAVLREGYLTEDVLARLGRWLPALGGVPDRAKVTPRALFSLITVEALCIVAQRRRDELAGGGATP